MIKTSEIDKVTKVQPQSQAIGEFLEWCEQQGIVFAHYVEGNELIPIFESKVKILARYFDIDLDLLEYEKLQLLDAIRSEQ